MGCANRCVMFLSPTLVKRRLIFLKLLKSLQSSNAASKVGKQTMGARLRC